MRRTLLTALTTLLALALLGLTAPAAAASPASDEQDFLRLLNQARSRNGLAPVVLDSSLSRDARGWSSQMGSANRLYHTPNQQMTNEVARVLPAWQRIGENVGVGQEVDSLHDAFWSSPGHRANMLGDFNRVGVGVVYSNGRTWVTFRYVKSPAASSGPTGMNTRTPFYDVPDHAYYTDAVAWLARNGVTTGSGGGARYDPAGTVTRAQMATFLWRLAGEPRASAPRFADVPPSAYYAPAVDWMRAHGLTNGIGSTNRFDPNGAVTREQMATFLHRFAGSGSAGARHGFVDVGSASYADAAVSWLQRYGITTGTSPDRYSPGGHVTRAQMAAFLHRLATSGSAMAPGAVTIRV